MVRRDDDARESAGLSVNRNDSCYSVAGAISLRMTSGQQKGPCLARAELRAKKEKNGTVFI